MDIDKEKHWPFKAGCNVCLKRQSTILKTQSVFETCIEMLVICVVCRTKLNTTYWMEDSFSFKDDITIEETELAET